MIEDSNKDTDVKRQLIVVNGFMPCIAGKWIRTLWLSLTDLVNGTTTQGLDVSMHELSDQPIKEE